MSCSVEPGLTKGRVEVLLSCSVGIENVIKVRALLTALFFILINVHSNNSGNSKFHDAVVEPVGLDI